MKQFTSKLKVVAALRQLLTLEILTQQQFSDMRVEVLFFGVKAFYRNYTLLTTNNANLFFENN